MTADVASSPISQSCQAEKGNKSFSPELGMQVRLYLPTNVSLLSSTHNVKSSSTFHFFENGNIANFAAFSQMFKHADMDALATQGVTSPVVDSLHIVFSRNKTAEPWKREWTFQPLFSRTYSTVILARTPLMEACEIGVAT